jgi:restriction system protein
VAKESLFSILSRQPWWVSLIVAILLFAAAEVIFPPLAPFVAIPFVLVSIWFAYQQMRGGSPTAVPERLAQLRDMPWENFSLVVSEAYRRRGYVVEESKDGAFDFLLRKDGRATLVQCRRWKVSQAGEGPLKELARAIEKNDAFNGIAITAGAFSEKAQSFAAGNPITLVSGSDLVELIAVVERKRWRWLPR